jgi:hypothetical protein
VINIGGAWRLEQICFITLQICKTRQQFLTAAFQFCQFCFS